MVRKLAGAFLVAGALTSQYAGALGLGELKLNSALNQPLNAEIKLVNVGDLTQDQVIVKLASQLAFEQAGVERDYFLTNLKFSVHLDGRGSGVIKIKTQNLVREPYLDFLIEARWPTGKVLREYTALVDLPVFSEKTQTSVNLGSARVEPQPQAVTRQPAPQQQTTYTPPASQSRYRPAQEVEPSSTRYTTSSGGGTYKIRKSDTLWDIARDARPSYDVSVHQTMMAIQQINPGAFIKNNINLLKSGHVLRLPTEDEVRDINNRRAVQQVAVQNKKWREKESVSGAQLDATGKKSTSKYAEVEGQLRLTSAEKASEKASGGNSAAGSNSANGVSGGDSQSLLEAKEEKAALELQNKELTGRMSDLEAQVEKLQRLVELKNNELARLQDNLAKTSEPVEGLIDRTKDGIGEKLDQLESDTESSLDGMKEDASKLAGDAKDSIGDTKSSIDGAIKGGLEKVEGKIDSALDSDAAMGIKDKLDSVADGVDTDLVDGDEVTDAVDAVKDGVDGAVDSTLEAGSDVVDSLEDGASSALDAGEDALDASVDAGVNAIESVKDAVPSVTTPDKPSFIDTLLEKPMYLGGALLALLAGLFALIFRKRGKKDEDDILDSVEDTAEEIDNQFDFAQPEETDSLVQDQELDLDNAFDELAGDVADEVEDAAPSTQPETGDAIGEADIYVAYGRYDQAADLLNNALDQDPSRDDIRLKLLEVHLESQNKEGFKTQYQQIASLGNDELKGKAKELLTNVEDASEWIDLDSTGIGGIAGASTLAGIGAAGAAASDLMDDKTIVQGADELELDNFSLDTVEDESIDAIDQLDIGALDENAGFEFDATLDLEDTASNAVDSASEDLDKTLHNLALTDTDLEVDLGSVDTAVDFDVSDDLELSKMDSESELTGDTDGIDLDATLDRAAETLDKDSKNIEVDGLDAGDLAAGATSAAALMALSEQGQSEDDLTDDEDEDLNFLTQSDQVATKLDLARAYIDMGDIDGAREILDEVVEEGESSQKEEAQALLDQL